MDNRMNLSEQVYLSLLGQLFPEDTLNWVENIFELGKPYYENYSNALDAYARLCQRLGTGEEDKDVEIIVDSLLANEKAVALKMFQYGLHCGKENAER